MSENVLQTVQQLVQEVIAPDVRELKVRVGVLERQIEALQRYVEHQFATLEKTSEVQFKALMTAISESKAQAELTSVRVLAALSERVAVLEAQRH